MASWRHLEPWQWGEAFGKLLEVKGVERGKGKVNQHTVASATMAEAAAEVGVPLATAEKRLRLAAKKAALPDAALDGQPLDVRRGHDRQARGGSPG